MITLGTPTLPEILLAQEGQQLNNAYKAVQLKDSIAQYKQRMGLLQDLQNARMNKKALSTQVTDIQAQEINSRSTQQEDLLNQKQQQANITELHNLATMYRARGFESEASKFEEDAKRISDELKNEQTQKRTQLKTDKEAVAGILRGVSDQTSLENSIPDLEQTDTGKTLVQQLQRNFGDGKGGIILSQPALDFIKNYRLRNMSEAAYQSMQDRRQKEADSLDQRERDRQQRKDLAEERRRDVATKKEQIKTEKETTEKQKRADRLANEYQIRLSAIEHQEDNITIAITNPTDKAAALANIARRKRSLRSEMKKRGLNTESMQLVKPTEDTISGYTPEESKVLSKFGVK